MRQQAVTAYLGAETDFPRRLREVDQQFKEAAKGKDEASRELLRVKEKIKETRQEALEPFADGLRSLGNWEAVLEQALGYWSVRKALEDARIASIENPGLEMVVFGIPIDKKLPRAWCRIETSAEAQEAYMEHRPYYVEFGRFRDGEKLEGEVVRQQAPGR
ncbi:hypothetical protein [Aminirod propionatiphilus]|uniref:Uncharacterized protein n=1 Tax=Aminirod propionatiphilus TaxID=3415223 RepID=A0ACD1DYI3_9BACT|nr:hypothetical protein KIH16_04370 [Synergistota bacterium]